MNEYELKGLAIRDQVWEFLRTRTVARDSGCLPFNVFVRCFHGWSAEHDLPHINWTDRVVEGLEAAGYAVTVGDRGDNVIRSLSLVPRNAPDVVYAP